MDSKYIFILLTFLIFAATDAQKINRKKRQAWAGGGADKITNSVGSEGRSPVKDFPSRDQLNSFFKPEQTSFTYKPVAKSSSLSAPANRNTITKTKKNLSGSTKSSGNGNNISNNNSGKRQGNGLTNWSGSRTQSQNTWGTFTTTQRPMFWRRNNFQRPNNFRGMGGAPSGGGGWSNPGSSFAGMSGGLQNMFAAATGHFMGDQQRMEAAIMAGTFARPLGGMSFDKTFDRSPPKIIPYGCPPGARQFVCTGFNPCEVGPCRRYPSARCWINACGGCSPEWWTHTFQRVMDCD